jgi:type II secretory pathway pseudopilin PulG
MHRHNKSKGFTLVEIAVVAPVLILMIGVIIVSIVTLTGQSVIESSKGQLINDVQDALDRIDADVQASGAYMSTNNITPVTPQGLNDDSQKFVSVSSTGVSTIILNSFVTTNNPYTASRNLVYLPNAPFACNDSNLVQNQVMTMNTVYFVKDSTLWRRLIAPNNYASKICSGNTIWQQPTCAETKISVNTTMCKVQDEKILSGIDPLDFSVGYYLSANDTTVTPGADDADSDARQVAIDKSSTMQITIRGKRQIAGQDITQQASIRVSRKGSIVKYATPAS